MVCITCALTCDVHTTPLNGIVDEMWNGGVIIAADADADDDIVVLAFGDGTDQKIFGSSVGVLAMQVGEYLLYCWTIGFALTISTNNESIFFSQKYSKIAPWSFPCVLE